MMTGHVAQVFLKDDDWNSTLKACRNRMKPGGRLVFDVRDLGNRLGKNGIKKTNKVINSPVGTIDLGRSS